MLIDNTTNNEAPDVAASEAPILKPSPISLHPAGKAVKEKRMLLTLRKSMITLLAGQDIAVLLNVEPLYVSLDWLKKVPASSVVDRGILKTRTRTANWHRYSQQNNGDG